MGYQSMDKKPRAKAPKKPPSLKQLEQKKWEDLLEFHLHSHGLGKLFIREYIAPELGRKWRWDFADVQNKVLIEVQGGIFAPKRMGHNTGTGIMNDHAKNNAATFHGFRVFQVSDRTIRDLTAIDFIVLFYREKVFGNANKM